MSKALLFLVVSLLASQAHAATYNAVITGATKNGSSWAIKSPSATVNAGSVQTTAGVQVGSGTATVSGGGISIAGGFANLPTTAQLASGAASVALTAVRLNPAGLMTSLVVSWLLQEGLQYVNDQWMKTQQGEPSNSIGFSWRDYAGAWHSSTAAACASSAAALTGTGTITGGVVLATNGPDAGYYIQDCYVTNRGTGYSNYHAWMRRSATCLAGYTIQGGLCVPDATSVPAIESDFTTVAASPIPDGAAGELIKVVPLPIEPPTFTSPSPVDLDSSPYLDPISGRLVKERTTVTPSPTAEDPLNVRVEKYVVDAGDVPGQTAAPPAVTKEASISNQPLNIEFPSDYARQGEAQAAADSINNTLGPKLDKITETGADPTDPAQPPGSEFDQAFFQGTFTSLLGWQLPAHTSQCPTSGFDWNGQTYTIDSHCQLVADHFGAFSTVMAVVWTVIALFILLGA